MKYTAKYIREKFDPCEDGISNFEQQYPGFEGTLEELLSLDNISYDDKIWLVCKVVDIKTLQQWTVECSEFVVDNFESFTPGDTRVRDCIETTKRYLDGAVTLEKLEAAKSAAAYAAWSTEYAARSAAWHAAKSVAESDAESAARSVEYAVWSAAGSEQKNINLSLLIALIENEG